MSVETNDVCPKEGGEYRGFGIGKRIKLVHKKNPISGHEWTEHEFISGFDISGPGVFLQKKFGTVKSAMEYIDFAIKFGLNKPCY